ncbi:MAG TPA: hypothetical protein VFM18_05610 [Methanosarcina sp.]|nr:hypothetical protein [Methanosarcina sp.]
MEVRYFSNNATTNITTDSGSTITVASTANFPSQYPFYVTAENLSLQREIIKVTGLASAGVWNVIRAQEGTTQLSFASGSKIELRLTAGTLNSLISDKAELAGATFTGTVNWNYGPGYGNIAMVPGSTTNSSYVAYFAPDGTRTGYIGWSDTSNLFIESENGRNLNFVANGYTSSMQLVYSGSGLPRMYLDGNKDVPRRYPAGSPLPTTDIGPIWHDDYQDWMIWQVFSYHGANYAGYASVNIGKVSIDPNRSPRTGNVPLGSTSLSKTTYAALWNWAIHNGYVIGMGAAMPSWQYNYFNFADNGDGTFKLPSIQDLFLQISNVNTAPGTGTQSYAGYFQWRIKSDDGDNSTGSYTSVTAIDFTATSNSTGTVSTGAAATSLGQNGTGAWNYQTIGGQTYPDHVSFPGYLKF